MKRKKGGGRMKREKYERWQFSLDECKTQINIIGKGREDPGYATAFLNVTLPDGRWICFKIADDMRVPLYKPNSEA